MKWFLRAGLAVAATFIVGGCDELEEDKVPDYGEVRVFNDSSQDIRLVLSGEEREVVRPGKQTRTRVGGEFNVVSIRDINGNELFTQTVELPENTFASYTVLEGGQVEATAGNIRTPDVVGGDDEQIALQNLAEYPVELYAEGMLLVRVPPLRDVTVNIPDTKILIRILRANGPTLFSQVIEVPNNTVIHYAVFPSGNVVATGGPIERNIDILRDRYPNEHWWFEDDRF